MKIKKLIMFVILISILGCIGFYFINPNIKNVFNQKHEFNLQIAAPILSGTPQIDLKPLPEVHIQADANALDKQRTFLAEKLSEGKFKEFSKNISSAASIPFAGFNIDARMTNSEMFHKQISVGFDLEKLNLPKNLWDKVRVVHMESPVKYRIMETTIKDNEAKCYVRHNGAFVLIVALGIVADYAYENEQAIKSKDQNYSGIEIPGYRILWNQKMEPAKKKNADEIKEKIISIMLKYGYNTLTKTWETGVSGAEKFAKDSEYLKLSNMTSNQEWVKENLWPVEVTYAVEAIKRADEYLFTQRGFRKPGYLIDVYITNDWSKEENQDAMAYAGDLAFSNPYLKINVSDSAIPNIEDWQSKPEKMRKVYQSGLDKLNMVVAHELFHIIENEYHPIDLKKYIWFDEACAVAMETEASKYYLSKGWIKNSYVTDREYWANLEDSLVPSDAGSDMNASRLHGYTVSFFFEFLRDNYYKGQTNKFLTNVLDDFATLFSSPKKALYRQTSSSSEKLGEDYLYFCIEKSKMMISELNKKINNELSNLNNGEEKYVKNIKNSLTKKNPYFRWSYADSLPMSCGFRKLNIEQEKDKNPVVVFRNNLNFTGSGGSIDIISSFSEDEGSKWVNISQNGESGSKSSSVWIRRINCCSEEQININQNESAAEVFAMYAPVSPSVYVDGNKLKISWKPGTLSDKKLIKGYRVSVKPNDGSKEIIIDAANTSIETNYPAKGCKVSYCEIANTKNEILGPYSSFVDVGEGKGSKFDLSGTWSGYYTIDSFMSEFAKNGAVQKGIGFNTKNPVSIRIVKNEEGTYSILSKGAKATSSVAANGNKVSIVLSHSTPYPKYPSRTYTSITTVEGTLSEDGNTINGSMLVEDNLIGKAYTANIVLSR
ncbi:MAG: hypothetical protein ACM3KR_07770 [Deltaproteobacteria bacterium]